MATRRGALKLALRLGLIGGALLLGIAASCTGLLTLLQDSYACAEEPGGCECKVGKAKAENETTSKCERDWGCCIDYSTGSVLPDDPNNGPGACICYDAVPGESCEDTFRKTHPYSASVESQPGNCPPLMPRPIGCATRLAFGQK